MRDAVVEQEAIGQAGEEVMLCRMHHLLGHGTRRADVAKENYGADDLPGGIVDGRDRIFDEDLTAVAAQKKTVRRDVFVLVAIDRALHRIWDNFAGDGIHNGKDGRHWLPQGLFPGPSSHLLSDPIEEGDVAGDVGADNCVADTVECCLGLLFFGV